MRAKRYGLFNGRVLDKRPETTGKSPHFHILLEGAGDLFRAAVNTRSGTSHHRTSELLYLADEDFRHPITARLERVSDGFHPLESSEHDLALDYQRGGLFDHRHMRRIPASRPGPRNDLVDELDHRISRAIEIPGTRLLVYGNRWGPEPGEPDHVFGFLPGNGMHDIHMNQGNRDEHWRDNGVWSDGALLFHEPGRRWMAIFLAFLTQSWDTDDTGNPLPYPDRADSKDRAHPDAVHTGLSIVAAYVHPDEEKSGVAHVALRNERGEPFDLTGWRLLNRHGDAAVLEGMIPPRQVRRFPLPDDVPLSARGGVIRLLDPAGDEIDAVSFTRREASQRHGSLTF